MRIAVKLEDLTPTRVYSNIEQDADPDFLGTGTLILLLKNGTFFANGHKAERQRALRYFIEHHKEMTLLWAWPGRWRTDIFRVKIEDLVPYVTRF